MAEFASKGVAGTGLGLGIAGTALGVMAGGLNGGLGGLFGGNAVRDVAAAEYICNEDHKVDRYEMAMEQKIAKLETDIALRDANVYTMNHVNDLRNYVDGKFANVNSELREIAVYQATNTASIACLGSQVAGIQGVLSSLTKTVIPSSNICDQGYPVIVTNTPCDPVYTKTISN